MFQRLGEGTDVVRKEMYDFDDKGDRHLALRPEGTASVARAFVQHRPPTPWKVWYVDPGVPLRAPAGRPLPPAPPGRRRGARRRPTPTSTSRSSSLAGTYLAALGLQRWRLVLNSMGDARRPAPRYAATPAGLAARPRAATWRRTTGTRSRRTRCGCSTRSGRDRRRVVGRRAPHRRRARRGVDRPLRPGAGRPGALGIPFDDRTRLVRGLDYYTHTTFEFQSDALDAAQSTIGGGGRYDGLVEAARRAADARASASARASSGCCWRATPRACSPRRPTALDVFVVDATDGSAARDLAHELRARRAARRPGVRRAGR